MVVLEAQEARTLAANWYRSTYDYQGRVKIVCPVDRESGLEVFEGANWRFTVDENSRVAVRVKLDRTVEEQ